SPFVIFTLSLHDALPIFGAAESGYRSPEGLAHLEAGLALLEEVALDAADEHRTVAANLLAAYSSRICQAVRGRVESDPALPEPEDRKSTRLNSSHVKISY